MGGNPNPKGGGGHAQVKEVITYADGSWTLELAGNGPCPYKEGDAILLAFDSPADNSDSGADGDSQK